jgi:hypothetical protein
MTQAGPPPPPPVTAIKLTDEIKEAVNGAFANGTPVVFAYVNQEGQPRLSLRGTAQAYSDDQLAVWVRNPAGGFLQAIDNNNRVTLLYRNPAARTNYFFQGRARIDNSEAVRKTVYDSSPEAERNADPEMKGSPAIIDLDWVEGGPPGNRVRMARNA